MTSEFKFKTVDGEAVVHVDVFRMSPTEAVDAYGLDQSDYATGGYRIEGQVNGVPAGQYFAAHGMLSIYYPVDGIPSDDCARRFLAMQRQSTIY